MYTNNPDRMRPRSGDWTDCAVCGEEFYRTPSEMGRNRQACSTPCRIKAMTLIAQGIIDRNEKGESRPAGSRRNRFVVPAGRWNFGPLIDAIGPRVPEKIQGGAGIRPSFTYRMAD